MGIACTNLTTVGIACSNVTARLRSVMYRVPLINNNPRLRYKGELCHALMAPQVYSKELENNNKMQFNSSQEITLEYINARWIRSRQVLQSYALLFAIGKQNLHIHFNLLDLLRLKYQIYINGRNGTDRFACKGEKIAPKIWSSFSCCFTALLGLVVHDILRHGASYICMSTLLQFDVIWFYFIQSRGEIFIQHSFEDLL